MERRPGEPFRPTSCEGGGAGVGEGVGGGGRNISTPSELDLHAGGEGRGGVSRQTFHSSNLSLMHVRAAMTAIDSPAPQPLQVFPLSCCQNKETAAVALTRTVLSSRRKVARSADCCSLWEEAGGERRRSVNGEQGGATPACPSASSLNHSAGHSSQTRRS